MLYFNFDKVSRQAGYLKFILPQINKIAFESVVI
jgi:hypothetical protein